MLYNNDWAREQLQGAKPPKLLCFWGHQPGKDGQITKACFSQWFERSFAVEGHVYPTAEHWMMAGKARLFEDDETLAKILNCATAPEVKKLGRQVRNWDEQEWQRKRLQIVIEGNVHKFSQHEDLKTFLLSTGKRILVEASPYDRIWGIGMRQDDKEVNHPDNWKGLNLLGYALMAVRDRLG